MIYIYVRRACLTARPLAVLWVFCLASYSASRVFDSYSVLLSALWDAYYGKGHGRRIGSVMGWLVVRIQVRVEVVMSRSYYGVRGRHAIRFFFLIFGRRAEK